MSLPRRVKRFLYFFFAAAGRAAGKPFLLVRKLRFRKRSFNAVKTG